MYMKLHINQKRIKNKIHIWFRPYVLMTTEAYMRSCVDGFLSFTQMVACKSKTGKAKCFQFHLYVYLYGFGKRQADASKRHIYMD